MRWIEETKNEEVKKQRSFKVVPMWQLSLLNVFIYFENAYFTSAFIFTA